MKKNLIQLLLGIQHFLVDAICAACCLGVLRHICGETKPGMFMLAMLLFVYNVLAFCTQWITGLGCDLLKNDRLIHLIAAAALVLGTAACKFFPLATVVLLGVGNSLFHVSGGRYVILNAKGKAAPLGVFVAPGALGLYAGTVFADFGWLFCLLMAIIAVILWVKLAKIELPEPETAGKFQAAHLLAVALVLVCIICRAASGAIPFPGKNIPDFLSWLPVLMIFAGKTSGGFSGDRWGYIVVGAVGFTVGTLLLAFSGNSAGYAVGQLLVNLLMPLTLWQICKLIPQTPGLAFGLAATVLVPGSWIRFSREPINVFLWLSAVSLICFIAVQIIIRYKKI